MKFIKHVEIENDVLLLKESKDCKAIRLPFKEINAIQSGKGFFTTDIVFITICFLILIFACIASRDSIAAFIPIALVVAYSEYYKHFNKYNLILKIIINDSEKEFKIKPFEGIFNSIKQGYFNYLINNGYDEKSILRTSNVIVPIKNIYKINYDKSNIFIDTKNYLLGSILASYIYISWTGEWLDIISYMLIALSLLAINLIIAKMCDLMQNAINFTMGIRLYSKSIKFIAEDSSMYEIDQVLSSLKDLLEKEQLDGHEKNILKYIKEFEIEDKKIKTFSIKIL